VKGAVRNEVQDMVERIHAGADEGRKSKGIKTAVLKFVDHFSSLIHQSSDTLVWPCSKLSRSPTLETVPRKYNNVGLRQHLKTKKTKENFDPYQNGGLDDEHASSVRPKFFLVAFKDLRILRALLQNLRQKISSEIIHGKTMCVPFFVFLRMKYLTNLGRMVTVMLERTSRWSLHSMPICIVHIQSIGRMIPNFFECRILHFSSHILPFITISCLIIGADV